MAPRPVRHVLRPARSGYEAASDAYWLPTYPIKGNAAPSHPEGHGGQYTVTAPTGAVSTKASAARVSAGHVFRLRMLQSFLPQDGDQQRVVTTTKYATTTQDHNRVDRRSKTTGLSAASARVAGALSPHVCTRSSKAAIIMARRIFFLLFISCALPPLQAKEASNKPARSLSMPSTPSLRASHSRSLSSTVCRYVRRYAPFAEYGAAAIASTPYRELRRQYVVPRRKLPTCPCLYT